MKTTLTTLVSICLPLLMIAQTQDTTMSSIDLDAISISASRSGSTINQLPLNVAVLTNRQISEMQSLTPVEALRSIPGIDIQSDGGLTSTPIIRGLSRERAPVLIDGNSFVGGRIRTYALIDPWQIDRMEVIKGPASAFWGSDAVSGLVNVVTRHAESGFGKDFKIGGSLYGGIQSVNNLNRARLELEGRGNGFDFLIGVGTRDAGNTKTPEGDVPNSQFESTYVDWNVGYSPTANQRYEISGKVFENDNVGFPGGLGAPGPPVRVRLFSPDIQKDMNFSYRGNNMSDKIEAVGVNAYFKQQRLSVDMITNVFFPMTTNINRIIHPMLNVNVDFGGAKGFMTLRQNDKAKLTLGVDYLSEHRFGTFRDLTIDIFNPAGVQVNQVAPPPGQIQPDSYSSSIGVFAVEEVALSDQLDLLLALRYDNVKTRINDGPFFIPPIAELYNDENKEDSEGALTGNLGLKYRASDNFNITANVANSFRGTDLFSKYHFAAGLIPNPELESEKGFFFELGADYTDDKFSAGVNYYQNSLTNLFVPANVTFNMQPAIQNQNIGEGKISGFEYHLSYQIGTLSSIFFNGSTINGKNTLDDTFLPFIPANRNMIGVQFRDKDNKFFGSAEAIFYANQDNLAPNERATDAYTLINVNAGINLHNVIDGFPNTKLMIGADNLADESYQSHVFRGLPANVTRFFAPGRSVNVSLVVKFGAAADH